VLTMHCTRVQLPHGIAIACTSHRLKTHRCEQHRAVAGFQCDWKTGPGKTCDRWLCGQCAEEVGPDRHLCPEHQAAYREWKAKRDQEYDAQRGNACSETGTSSARS
jgi:hypothetical protein